MAGGGGGLQPKERVKRGSFAKKRKKKKRVGFVLDMTPLVDIAFLLLTFFMFATTMNQPQTMEMSIPPQVDNIDVRASELLYLKVRDDGKVFYTQGLDPTNNIAINLKDLKSFLINENLRVENRLITALKVSKNAPYGRVVDVLDELNLAEYDITSQLTLKNIKRERKFSLVPMTPEEVEEIKSL